MKMLSFGTSLLSNIRSLLRTSGTGPPTGNALEKKHKGSYFDFFTFQFIPYYCGSYIKIVNTGVILKLCSLEFHSNYYCWSYINISISRVL